jgi:hypothetical protein
MNEHTSTPWRLGRTLRTRDTARWTTEQWEASERQERLRIFTNFTAVDEGRGRIFIAQAISDVLVSQEEAEANARLIASSPDLYAALQWILKKLAAQRTDELPKFWPRVGEECEDIARNALEGVE